MVDRRHTLVGLRVVGWNVLMPTSAYARYPSGLYREHVDDYETVNATLLPADAPALHPHHRPDRHRHQDHAHRQGLAII